MIVNHTPTLAFVVGDVVVSRKGIGKVTWIHANKRYATVNIYNSKIVHLDHTRYIRLPRVGELLGSRS